MRSLNDIGHSIASTVEDPLGSLRDLGEQASQGFKDLGGINPLHKVVNNFQATPTLNAFNANLDPNSFQNKFKLDTERNNFQAHAPDLDRANYIAQLNNQMGRDTAGGVFGSPGGQGLIGQLQQEAAGNGPGNTLAQNMLHQATQENIKQGAGLIASTKGINPALAARLAADQAGNMNQQAAMQGANLGLQQQLNARQQLGSIGLGAGGLENQRFGTLAQALQGQNALSQQGSLEAQRLNQNTEAQNAGLAQQVQQLGADIATGNANRAAGIGQNNQAINAGVAGQNAGLGMQAQEISAGVAKGNAATQGQLIGGGMNAIGGMFGQGGIGSGIGQSPSPVFAPHGQETVGGAPNANFMGPPSGAAMDGMSLGGEVAGTPKVAGDSPTNDTVDAKLSPGEIVIPRTAADNPEAAKSFIDALMGNGKKSGKGFGSVLQAKRELAELKGRAKALEEHIRSAA